MLTIAIAPPAPYTINAERLTWGLGDSQDHQWRNNILRKYPNSLANKIAKTYARKWGAEGHRNELPPIKRTI